MFLDQSESAMHLKSTIDKIEKVTNLKSYLRHYKKLVIAALALTTENYKQAIEICKERCGNPRFL